MSERNPKIAYSQKFAPQIPWFIGLRIKEMARYPQRLFTVLIISPTKVQCRHIAATLKNKGFAIIEHVERSGGKGPTLLDGLKLLLEDDESNLGWRIACKYLLSAKDFESLVNGLWTFIKRKSHPQACWPELQGNS